MAFAPDSVVHLLDVPLDNKYKNQLHFDNITQQYNYFIKQKTHSYSDVTFQRKDSTIRVSADIDTLWNANYVMYRNIHFTTKWFYAFITNITYVSAHVTEISIETDVYQTWLSECKLKPSFVVREHVADDTIGLHLVDEQLETGEYKVAETEMVGKMGANWNILAVSEILNDEADMVGNIYGNVVTGLLYYPFPNTNAGVEWLKRMIRLYDQAGKPDAIVMIFSVPELIIPIVNRSSWSLGHPIQSGEPYGFKLKSFTKPLADLDGYVPKNKKMFTNPYKYFYLSNSTGQSANYNYENFSSITMDFIIFGSVMPNPMVMMSPSDYLGRGGYEYGLTLTGFPMGSWTSDAYTAWFAQNGASAGVALVGSTVALVAGIATGNPMAIAGGAMGVSSQMAQINKASKMPDQAKGQVGSGSLRYGDNSLDFTYAHMTIKKEAAKRIDDYLTMFGYKVNALKIPETKSRSQWNYVQTIDVNIDGSIPHEDMNKLKSMYNEGVTFWHNPTNFLNYSLNNPII